MTLKLDTAELTIPVAGLMKDFVNATTSSPYCQIAISPYFMNYTEHFEDANLVGNDNYRDGVYNYAHDLDYNPIILGQPFFKLFASVIDYESYSIGLSPSIYAIPGTQLTYTPTPTPSPTKEKMQPIVIFLIVLGVLIVLGAIGIVGYFIYKKSKAGGNRQSRQELLD